MVGPVGRHAAASVGRNDAAAGNGEGAATGALTVRADADIGPGAVEIAATTAATPSRAARRLLRLRLAAPARAIRLDRTRFGPRARYRLVVVADAAAGAALRARGARSDHIEEGKNKNR